MSLIFDSQYVRVTNNSNITKESSLKYFIFIRLFCFVISSFCLIFLDNIPLTFADQVVKKGDKISIEYEGSLNDGTVFDNSKSHNKPFQFIVGSGQVIPGFDKAVVGMKLMEEKKFTLQPAEAYGEKNLKLIHKVLRSELPPEPEPKPGMGLMMGGGPRGKPRRAMITEVTKKHIVIDMNHLLAGKALTFSIKLIKISN
ncbi:MAG: peptidylprolyl isomerase [Nitrospina sp.]|nr:peptidylprolyl isomerase [Nitrospina sp.]